MLLALIAASVGGYYVWALKHMMEVRDSARDRVRSVMRAQRARSLAQLIDESFGGGSTASVDGACEYVAVHGDAAIDGALVGHIWEGWGGGEVVGRELRRRSPLRHLVGAAMLCGFLTVACCCLAIG